MTNTDHDSRSQTTNTSDNANCNDSDRTENKEMDYVVIPDSQDDIHRAIAESVDEEVKRKQSQDRLHRRVHMHGLGFPSNREIVREQGDCFPDSVAHHIAVCNKRDVVGENWHKVRDQCSLDVRKLVCDYMIKNPSIKPPNSELALNEILPQPNWEAYCNRFRKSGVKVENPFIAATALRYGMPIVIISSVECLPDPIHFNPIEQQLSHLYLANLEDIHFEPLRPRPIDVFDTTCRQIDRLDMDEKDDHNTNTQTHNKRRRATGGDEQPSRVVDELVREPRTLPAANKGFRRGTKRGNQPSDVGAGLNVNLAPEREALLFYQPWFDVIERRPTPGIDTEQGQPAVDPLLAKTINHKTHIYKRIPPRARQALVAAVKPALQTMVGGIVSDNTALFNRALQAFFVVPQFALAQRHNTPAKAADIEASILRFMDGPTLETHLTQRPANQGSLTEHELAVRKAIRPATHGAMLKATQRLETLHSGLSGICEPTDDIVEQLHRLHPAPTVNEELPSPLNTSPTGLPVSRAKLRLAGKKIANGSAADLFGWTGELLTPLLRDKDCVSLLTTIAAYIRDGLVTGVGRDWLLASWLVALDKGSGKIRPIAGGTILFKLVATYLTQQATGAAHALFARTGVQFGVFTSDGVTAAARLNQLTLDANPTHTVLKTDFKNAFNLLSRKLMLQELFSYPELAPLHRMVHWAYSAESALFARGKDGVAAVIRSRQGVRQGCVFGSIGYAVATLRILKTLKDNVGCEVVGVLDDVSLAGPPTEVFAAFDKLCAAAKHNNLSLQPEKCAALWPLQNQDHFKSLLDSAGIRAADGCMQLLGTAVGNDPNKIAEWVRDKVETWEAPLRDLKSRVVPAQVALLLARTYATSKTNFLTRSLPPSFTKEPLNKHDREVLSTVSSKLNLEFPDPAEAMLRLPFSCGGVGLTSSAVRADQAFVASMATTLPYIAASRLLRNVDLTTLPTMQRLGEALATVDGFTPSACPTDLTAFISKFSTNTSDSFGLQSAIGRRQTVQTEQRVWDAGFGMRALQGIRNNNHAASAPFRAYPLTAEFTLTNDDVRFAVAHATCAKIPEMPAHCTCEKEFSLGHAVSCNAKMVLARHNRIQDKFAALARMQGITVVATPRLTLDAAAQAQVPDLLLFIGVSPPLEVDVTITDPLCPSQRRHVPGDAVRAAEKRKRDKYQLAAGTRGHDFAPLAMDTHGTMGTDVLKVLKRIAAHTPGEVGLSDTDMLMELQVDLLKGNAECARVVFARALARQDKTRQRC